MEEHSSKNYDEILKSLHHLAEYGDSNAQCCLGNCYLEGLGVEKNYGKAIELYRRSADLDNECAQYKLGYCYSEGLGVEKDIDKATQWYRRSAANGNTNAMSKLPFMDLQSILIVNPFFVLDIVKDYVNKKK